jgi:hypothetical protein
MTSGSPVTGPNKTISPFSLERKGAVLTGKLKGVTKDGVFTFQDDRPKSLQVALEGHAKVTEMIRAFVTQLKADTDERFPSENPESEWEVTNESLLTDPGIHSLNASDTGITNVLWTCGWKCCLDWLKVDQTTANQDSTNERTSLIRS